MVLTLTFTEVADEADKYRGSVLTADEGAQYDRLIEINLSEVR